MPEGKSLVGFDASGLELRMLAHYMDDKDYTNEILNGDIHTANQELDVVEYSEMIGESTHNILNDQGRSSRSMKITVPEGSSTLEVKKIVMSVTVSGWEGSFTFPYWNLEVVNCFSALFPPSQILHVCLLCWILLNGL